MPKFAIFSFALVAAPFASPVVGEWKIIESTCNSVIVVVNGKEVKTVICQATRNIIDTAITLQKPK